jgi:hypothetical protein
MEKVLETLKEYLEYFFCGLTFAYFVNFHVTFIRIKMSK